MATQNHGTPQASEKTRLEQKKRREQNWNKYNTPERPITIFPAKGFSNTTEKWGVAKLPEGAQKIDVPLMVIGTGRCGTDNIAKLMTKIGADFGHEVVRADGCSTHFFYVDSDWYPMQSHDEVGVAHVAQRPSDFNFKHVVHLVRNPLITVSSITEIFKPLEFEFLEENGVIPIVDRTKKKREYRGMLAWYYMNKKIDEAFPDAPLMRIEELNEWWPKLLDMASLQQVPKPDIGPSNKSGFRTKSHWMTPKEMFAIDAELAEKIFDLAEKYGYSLWSK